MTTSTWTDRTIAPRRRSVFDAVESIVLLGALALIAMPAIKGIARRYRVRNPSRPGTKTMSMSRSRKPSRQRRTGIALRRHSVEPRAT